jgi:hypothetical protein
VELRELSDVDIDEICLSVVGIGEGGGVHFPG